jgi:hypothetical protein
MAITEVREAITIRFPSRVLDSVREAKEDAESLNDFVVRVLEKEARWIKARKAHAAIVELREEIRKRTGVQPDSTQLIRDLREGRGRYD